MSHNGAFRSIFSWYPSRSRGPRSSRKARVTLFTYIPFSTLGVMKISWQAMKRQRRPRRRRKGEMETVTLTITPSCPTGPGFPTSPSSPWQQSCIFSKTKTRYAHTNKHAGQLPSGNANLLSNRSGLTNSARHSRLTLRHKKDGAAWI